jgi:hypothetical protein
MREIKSELRKCGLSSMAQGIDYGFIKSNPSQELAKRLLHVHNVPKVPPLDELKGELWMMSLFPALVAGGGAGPFPAVCRLSPKQCEAEAKEMIKKAEAEAKATSDARKFEAKKKAAAALSAMGDAAGRGLRAAEPVLGDGAPRPAAPSAALSVCGWGPPGPASRVNSRAVGSPPASFSGGDAR